MPRKKKKNCNQNGSRGLAEYDIITGNELQNTPDLRKGKESFSTNNSTKNLKEGNIHKEGLVSKSIECSDLTQNKNVEKHLSLESNEEINICIIISYSFNWNLDDRRLYYLKEIHKIKESLNKLQNFTIKVLIDLSLDELTEAIDKLMDMVIMDFQKLMIVLITHGINDIILIKDERLSLKSFYKLFNKAFINENLVKIFLLSFCRGDKRMYQEIKVNIKNTPLCQFKNTLICHSQFPGYKAYSGKSGDIYINQWFDILSELFDYGYDVDAIEVQKECEICFENININNNNEKLKQIPEHCTTLPNCILYQHTNHNIHDELKEKTILNNLMSFNCTLSE